MADFKKKNIKDFPDICQKLENLGYTYDPENDMYDRNSEYNEKGDCDRDTVEYLNGHFHTFKSSADDEVGSFDESETYTEKQFRKWLGIK